MADHINIVSEFNKQDYGYVFTAPIIEAWNRKGESLVPANSDAACYAMPVEERVASIKSILHKGGISEYHIVRKRDAIETYVRTEFDVNLLMAGIKHRMDYKVDFIKADPDVPAEKLTEKVKSLRETYNKTSLKGKVFFQFDEKRNAIYAITRSGGDMVDFYGQTRKMDVERILAI